MKKNTIVIAFFLIAALAAACVELLEPGVKAPKGKYSLDLSVRCQDPATKATIAGVDTLHENTLTRVDWFIFKSTSDNARAVLDDVTFYEDTTVTEPILVASVDMEDYIDPSTKTFTGYVFLLANLPASNTHASLAALTLGELKQLQVSTTLDLLGTDGKFKAQDNFVMASSTAPAQFPSFSLSENSTTATVTAPLSRVAAKITLDISIVSAIDEIKAQMSGRDTLAEEYLQTWYPDVNNIQVYLTYANQHTTIDRTLYGTEPFSYQDAYFFTYNRYGFKSTATKNDDNSWNVTGTPFYSYPMKWVNSDAHAPFIKIILPWRPYVEDPTYNANYKYITHDGQGGTHVGNKLVSASRNHIDDTSAATQEFFYKINLPLEDHTLSSNTWYKIALDVAILGGRTDDVSMELAGKYYVVDWNSPTFQAGGELTQGSYLSLATPRDTFYIYGGNSIEIPVKSSHDLEVVNPNSTYYNYRSANPTPGSLTYSTTSSSGANYTITPDGRSSVTLTHEVVSDLDNVSSRDVSTITYNFRIRHKNNVSSLYKDITVIQYPPIYIESLEPGDAFLDGRGQGTTAVGTYPNTYGYINYDSKPTTIYHVHVSAFNGNAKYYTPIRWNEPNVQYEYIITDPRVNAGWYDGDILPYRPNPNNAATTEWPVATVQNMMKGNPTPNYIAPSFIVSSRYGRPGNSTADLRDIAQAEKRCATYQEAGYPAGRWRLPTEAEVYFLYKLQDNQLITDLYTADNNSYGYMASSGYVFGRRGNTDFRRPSDDPMGNGSVFSLRCVYDTWYWGDKPDTRDTYHPGPTIYNN